MHTFSSWDSVSQISNSPCDSIEFKDPFEGIFYRTQIYETKLHIQFVSNAFFGTFRRKIHYDFMNSIDIDETNFISKCTTHIKGAKCNIKVDSHFKSVELSGLGFKLWREERFPQIAKSLFKRIMQDLDSQAENSSKFELTTEDISDTAHIERNSQEKLDRESFTTNNGTDVRPNVNVAPFNATRLRDTDNVINDARINKVAQECATSYVDMDSGFNVDGQASASKIDPLRRYCVNGEQSESVRPHESFKQFTAEKINNSFCHRINTSTSAEQELCLRDNTGHNLFMKENNEKQCDLEKSLSSNERTASKITTQPVFTSTPILMRNEGNNAYTSQSILSVFNRIDQLDSNIKAVKRDIILQMEKKA